MPEIDSNKLIAKLDTIPEDKRKPYLDELKSKGYTWKKSTPENSQSNDSSEPDLKQILTGTGFSPLGTMGGAGLNVLEGAARAGRYIGGKVDQAAQYLSDKLGKPGAALGAIGSTLSDVVLPRTKLQAALAAVSAAAGTKSPDIAEESKATGLAKNLKTGLEVKKPNFMEKLGGQAVSSTTAVPERYTSAVMANPDILKTAETPAEVGLDYKKVFDKYGIDFNSDFVKEITGKRYIPDEKQSAQSYKIIDDLLTKYENVPPEQIPPNEAFLGRSVAASLKRSDRYAKNQTFTSVVNGAQNFFDTALEKNNMPEFKQLGQRYFRAVAKEAFDSFLPRNKNMSPNAIRSMIALKMGADAAGKAMSGKIPEAIGGAVQAAAMSPMLVASGISGASDLANVAPLIKSSVPLSVAALRRKRQEEDNQ